MHLEQHTVSADVEDIKENVQADPLSGPMHESTLDFHWCLSVFTVKTILCLWKTSENFGVFFLPRSPVITSRHRKAAQIQICFEYNHTEDNTVFSMGGQQLFCP